MPHICFLFTSSLHRPLHLPPLESNCCERVGLSSSPTWRSRDSPHTSSRPWEGNWNLLPFSTGAFFTPGCYFPDSDWFVDCCSYFLDFRSRNENWKKHVWIRSEPVQCGWLCLTCWHRRASLRPAQASLHQGDTPALLCLFAQPTMNINISSRRAKCCTAPG